MGFSGELVLIIVINLVLSFIPASIARTRGRSELGFFALSFFLSFVVALIVVLISPPLETVKTDGPISAGDRVKCPHCAEAILAEAKVCKHCGRDVKPLIGKRITRPKRDTWCSVCRELVPGLDKDGNVLDSCPECGARGFVFFEAKESTGMPLLQKLAIAAGILFIGVLVIVIITAAFTPSP